MESVGAAGHGADLVVQSFVAAVGKLPGDGGVGADRGGGPEKFLDVGFGGEIAPGGDHLHDVIGVEVVGEDLSK